MLDLALFWLLALGISSPGSAEVIRVEMPLTHGVSERHRLVVRTTADLNQLRRVVAMRFRSISSGVVPIEDLELLSGRCRRWALEEEEECWTLRYKDKNSGTGLVDALLRRVSPLLLTHGIRFLLNYGSLLGAVRQTGMHLIYPTTIHFSLWVLIVLYTYQYACAPFLSRQTGSAT